MATALIDKQKNALLKKFHTLCGQQHIDNDTKHMMILANYGVESSKDLNAFQLLELCSSLDKGQQQKDELDKKRKQLIASIGGWLRAMGMTDNIDKIKSIACRASECSDFNRIPKERLNSLYYAFKKAQKDLKQVDGLTAEMLDYLSSNN
jgi:GH18 family chitinase